MSSMFGFRKSVPKESDKLIERTAELVTSKEKLRLRDMTGGKPFTVCHVHVEYGSVRNFKGSHENEDRVINFQDDSESGAFSIVGVLDGHDTESASDTVSRLLAGAVSKRLKDDKTIVEAYTEAMAEMEDKLKKVHASAGTCVNSSTIAGRFVFCANLGDCRAALVTIQEDRTSKGGPKPAGLYWMSEDHKASCPNEIKRITAAGGKIVGGRVEGLEPSRTLGDFDVKLSTKPGVISIIPDIRYFELGDGKSTKHAILVCGTDGVWDVITGKDICNLIQARAELGKLMDASASGETVTPSVRRALRDLADDVVQFAVAKGSLDDCTCIATLITLMPAS